MVNILVPVFYIYIYFNGPPREKNLSSVAANNIHVGADQPAHPRSLISDCYSLLLRSKFQYAS